MGRAMNPGKAVVLGIVLLAAGCASGPQPVPLHPTFDLPSADIGRGLPVAVEVVDVRPDPTLSDVPATVAARKRFPIAGDVVAVIRDRIEAGLAASGFAPVEGGDADRSVTVEIRRLDHSLVAGFGTSDVEATAAIAVIAHRGTGKLQVLHQARQHQQVAVKVREQDVEEAVNGALAVVLQRILHDLELLGYLAAPS
jgi:uncharacterized lipoprotein YajG